MLQLVSLHSRVELSGVKNGCTEEEEEEDVVLRRAGKSVFG